MTSADVVYPPPAALAADANVTAADAERLRAEADADPDAFWLARAADLEWERTPTRAREGAGPGVRWFADGRLNVARNCVDRHVGAGRGEKVALHWEGEPGDTRTVTYAELQRQVARCAHALTGLGVRRGDVVVVYLPVLVETVVVMLACARIGALHSMVFGGFSAEALRFRITDGSARLLVTTDGQFRRGRTVPVKEDADAAVEGVDSVEHVLVVRRTGSDVAWTAGRDVWWHDVVDTAPDTHEAEAFDAETPLFLIYTSGTTGRPKGLVHTMGGYLVQTAWTAWACFDHRDDDVYWCQADLAWVTAHTYEVYGPLANGVTQVLYEGTPDTPHRGRHFEILERYGVTVYYTAPTLVRTFMAWGEDVPAGYDLSRLRLLGSVGEAINPEAWRWLHTHVGGGRCPVVDTWWQSETGAAIVAPLPGATPLKPGSATRALPGLSVRVVDEHGRTCDPDEGGLLVIDRPWPAMARTVWGDPERFERSYFATFAAQGWYLAGDGARIDADGYVWLQGRVDDVMNVSGHRLSSIEVESALITHPRVAEAGVVGAADATTGQAIVAFVVVVGEHGVGDDPAAAQDLLAELRAHVGRELGPVARPREVVAVGSLPKTRSGKIMRRLLLGVTAGEEAGDTTSLVDPDAFHALAADFRDRRTR